MNKSLEIIRQILDFSPEIRYVALYKQNILSSREKKQGEGHSASETDHYEELFVNPALLKLTTQRGNIDCGGLRFIVVRYGNFYQLVHEIKGGHISICLEKSADMNMLPMRILNHLKEQFNYYLYKM